MKIIVEYYVWVDYTVLGTYSSLADAVKNADKLVTEYGDYEDEDYPRIYKIKYYVSSLCTYKDVSAMYDISGNIVHDFETTLNNDIND